MRYQYAACMSGVRISLRKNVLASGGYLFLKVFRKLFHTSSNKARLKIQDHCITLGGGRFIFSGFLYIFGPHRYM